MQNNLIEISEKFSLGWKQYSGRKHTVPGTVLFLTPPDTGILQELASFLPKTYWNAAVSTGKLTESTCIRLETDGNPNQIFFTFLSIKNPFNEIAPQYRLFLNYSGIFNPQEDFFGLKIHSARTGERDFALSHSKLRTCVWVFGNDVLL